MSCIDTHSHIYGEEFDADLDAVVLRAQAAGVGKIFLPNINAASVQRMLYVCQKYPGNCYPMIGLHPEDVDDDWQQTLADMERLLAEPHHPFIAVGEVGLDYYWDRSRYDEQQEVFGIQAGWALKYGLPLMIHTRNAHHEVVNVLHSVQRTNGLGPTLSGVFHCFGGSSEEAEELLAFEHFMLGIGGIVTFKKSKLPDVLKQTVPIERIVVETDSPYLAPTPHRGKRNESAYVTLVIQQLAEIYGVTYREACEITTSNALQIFERVR